MASEQRKLSPKQAKFIEEYLIDLNATQAAIRAGYSLKSARQTASDNLSIPYIAAALEAARLKASASAGITQERVLREYAKLAFSDIRSVVRWGNTEVIGRPQDDGTTDDVAYHGLAVIDSSQIDDDTAAAIMEVSEGREGLKVKLHDKRGALDSIARHLGMFKDKDATPPPAVQFVANLTSEEASKVYQKMMG